MFIRKVAPEFPDYILRHYIFERYEEDSKIILEEPFEMIFNRSWFILKSGFIILLFLVVLYNYLY